MYRNFHLLKCRCIVCAYMFRTLLIFDITNLVTVWNRLEPNAKKNWPKNVQFGFIGKLACATPVYVDCTTYLRENILDFFGVLTMSLIIHIIHTCFIFRFDIAVVCLPAYCKILHVCHTILSGMQNVVFFSLTKCLTVHKCWIVFDTLMTVEHV